MNYFKVMIGVWTVVILTMLFVAGKAQALDVAVGDHNGQPVIFVSGEYYEYDQEIFTTIAEANPEITIVVLTDSDGGITSASYPIARYIKAHGMDTIVAAGSSLRQFMRYRMVGW